MQELARRLSKSSAMHKLQQLQQAVAQQEKQLQVLAGDAKEVGTAQVTCASKEEPIKNGNMSSACSRASGCAPCTPARLPG